MDIKPNFNMQDIRKRFKTFLNTLEKRQIERLSYLGEQCVILARSLPPEVGFRDQTGHLRSSIGYIVFKNGVAVRENYQGASVGTNAGRNLANKIASKYIDGIVLVVTAGMNYALAVESRGKDVLTSAEQLAQVELPRMLKELKGNINKALR